MPKEEENPIRQKYASLLGNTNAKKYTEKDLPKVKQKIIDYFEWCDKNEKPYTMSGLALELGMSRNTLVNYGKDELFCDLISNAKQIVENQLECKLTNKNDYCIGIFLSLKNNYGWKDQQEIKSTNEVAFSPIEDAMNALKESMKE